MGSPPESLHGCVQSEFLSVVMVAMMVLSVSEVRPSLTFICAPDRLVSSIKIGFVGCFKSSLKAIKIANANEKGKKDITNHFTDSKAF